MKVDSSPRQVLAVIALAIAVFATVATTSVDNSHVVDGNDVQGTLVLNESNSLVVQILTVRLNDVAGGGSTVVTLHRTDSSNARFMVAPIDPAAEAGLETPTADGSLPSDALDLAPDQTDKLDVGCQASCERSFRLVAYSTDEGDVSATWSASASMTYRDTWPSGAAIELSANAPASAGAGRVLAAELPTDSVAVDAAHPAAGRLIEIRLAAAAIPADPNDVLTSAVLTSSEAMGDRSPVNLIALDTSSVTPALSLPQFDPFADCVPGQDCVRRFMLTAQWWDDPIPAVTWSLRVTQVRLRGQVAPADALSIKVVRTYEVAAEPPQVLRVQGSFSIGGPKGPSTENSDTFSVFAVQFGNSDVSLGTLPIPGTVDFAVSVNGLSSLPSGDTFTARLGHDSSPDMHIYGTGEVSAPLRDTHGHVTAPMAFQVQAYRGDPTDAPSPEITVHWTMELKVYRYSDLPVFQMSASTPTTSP